MRHVRKNAEKFTPSKTAKKCKCNDTKAGKFAPKTPKSPSRPSGQKCSKTAPKSPKKNDLSQNEKRNATSRVKAFIVLSLLVGRRRRSLSVGYYAIFSYFLITSCAFQSFRVSFHTALRRYSHYTLHSFQSPRFTARYRATFAFFAKTIYNSFMAHLHFLNGGYTGKLGVTYGVKAKQQNLVKVIPFSHTPHNQKQTNAVRAFEKLNRFSSFIAKTFWYNLNLSDRKMLKHNAVAHWLKPCVKNGQFKLENLYQVIPSNSSLKITSSEFDFSAKTASVTFENSPLSDNTTSESIFIALVTDNGTVKAGGVFSATSQTVDFSWDYSDFVSLTAVVFKSSVVKGKKIITGLNLDGTAKEYVVDGILYTSALPLTATPTVSAGILTFAAADANIADNILHFLNA